MSVFIFHKLDKYFSLLLWTEAIQLQENNVELHTVGRVSYGDILYGWSKIVCSVSKFWWEPTCAGIGGFMTLHVNALASHSFLRNALWSTLLSPHFTYIHWIIKTLVQSMSTISPWPIKNSTNVCSQHATLSLLCLPKWTWQYQRQFESSDRSQTHTHAFTLMCFQTL